MQMCQRSLFLKCTLKIEYLVRSPEFYMKIDRLGFTVFGCLHAFQRWKKNNNPRLNNFEFEFQAYDHNIVTSLATRTLIEHNDHAMYQKPRIDAILWIVFLKSTSMWCELMSVSSNTEFNRMRKLQCLLWNQNHNNNKFNICTCCLSNEQNMRNSCRKQIVANAFENDDHNAFKLATHRSSLNRTEK